MSRAAATEAASTIDRRIEVHLYDTSATVETLANALLMRIPDLDTIVATDQGRVVPRAEPHKSSTPTSDTAKTRKRGHEHLSAALIFGLVGMITGSLSLYIAWRTTSEEAATVLSAFPTASNSDLTHAGFGVRTQLVNKSLRPVIVQGGSLWVDGNKISDATGFLDDASPPRPVESVPRRDHRRTTGLPDQPQCTRRTVDGPCCMDVWRPIVAADSPEAALNARSSLNQLLTSVGSLASGGEHEIELGLDLAPGGVKRFPIAEPSRARHLPGSDSQRERHPAAGPARELARRRRRHQQGNMAGLSLRRRFAGGGQADLVRLDVWQERSPYHRTYTRPVLGQQAQLFPLRAAGRTVRGDLPAGRRRRRLSLVQRPLERDAVQSSRSSRAALVHVA